MHYKEMNKEINKYINTVKLNDLFILEMSEKLGFLTQGIHIIN
jgi:hypothetical protein